MSVRVTYQPPKVDVGAVVHAAIAGAETAAANHILEASKPLVPVDTGQLVASGHVEHDAAGAAIIYSAQAPDGYDYAAKQHEELDYHHEHGQAKYLEQPLHSEASAVAALIAVELRKALAL